MSLASSQIDLSISLVSCNSKDLLANCLTSIFNNTEHVKFEVLLVDNGSKDGTPAMVRKNFPQVKLTKNTSNMLYTKAHNKNLRKAQGKYFLVLNEDTFIPPRVLQKIIMFMEKHPNIGLASCHQVDEERQTNITSERFPHPVYELFEKSHVGKLFIQIFHLKKPKQMLAYFRYGNWGRRTTRQVDVIPGSFFFGRSELLHAVGLFDENLLLYYEESDYCQRARKKGYTAYHVGNVTVEHYKSKAIQANLSPFRRYQIAEHDMLTYYKKYFGLRWLVFLWLIFRPNWLYWKLHSLVASHKTP